MNTGTSTNKNFKVYRSSAGSGKTFTLVKEYLQLIFTTSDPSYYRHILAITFTNKATGEMKSRVLKTLSDFSSGEATRGTSAELLKALKKETGLDEKVIKGKSAKVLESILHNYADFNISTIDGFTNKVVRTFAHDLKLPINFDIELKEENLLRKAVDLLMSKVGEDKKVTELMIAFARHKAQDDKSWNVDIDLFEYAGKAMREDVGGDMERLSSYDLDYFFKLANSLKKDINSFKKKVKTIGDQALNIIRENGIEESHFAGGSRQGISKYFHYLSEVKKDKLIPTKTVLKNIDEDKWTAGKADASSKKSIDGVKDKLKALFNEALEIVNAEYETFIIRDVVMQNIYSIALLSEVEKLLEELKKDNNVLYIRDLNRRITDVVKHEPVPFVYERIGERYRNYLIDEFQDTSVIQWHNLLPLVDNSLAYGEVNLLVGDPKQAIYRWRGGEVDQLVKLPEIKNPDNNPLLQERQVSLERNFHPENLGENYRSHKEVIAFNNRFFEETKNMLHEDHKEIYKNLEQGFGKDKEGGFVNIEFIDQSDREEYEDNNCKRVFEIIGQALDRGADYKDIALLTRKNTEADMLARYLIQKGVPVVSSNSLLLKNSPEVKLIFNLLTLICDPNDHNAMVRVMKYLCESESEFHIAASGIPKNKKEAQSSFHELLKNKGIEIHLKDLVMMPVFDITEELIRKTNLNKENNPYLQFFLDTVLDYSEDSGESIFEFLNWWEENKKNISIIVPEGFNALTATTIHKSKGLEFPIVIYPFAREGKSRGNKLLWFELNNEAGDLPVALLPAKKILKEETRFRTLIEREESKDFLDLINLLYVTHTRAARELYILTATSQGDSKDKLELIYENFLKAEGKWEEGKLVFSFGDREDLSSEEELPDNLIGYDKWISKDWRGRISISHQSGDYWSGGDEKRDMGTLVHTLLANIENKDEVKSEVEKMKNRGLITTSQAVHLESKISNLMKLDTLRPWFEKEVEVKNEAEVMLPDGNLYRPDRVVIDGKQAVIIDYKTGEKRNRDKKQIKEYGDVLKKMGYEGIKGFLVYLMLEEVVEVLEN